jgi:hypothetical protein
MQPASSKERAALLDRLNDQRSHVLGVMKWLPEEAVFEFVPAGNSRCRRGPGWS